MYGEHEAPLYVAGEPRSENDYLIYTKYHAASDPTFAHPEDILRRHGIEVSAGYLHEGFLVGARLDDDQLAAIRRDRQVDYVERDCVEHVARYFRHRGPSRIEGLYTVAGVDGADVRRLAGRHGITPTRGVFLDALPGFAAELSDEQRDRLRHDPEVAYIEDECWEGV